MSKIKILILVTRIALGGLFVYAGIQKFIPKPPRPVVEQNVEIPDHVVKIKSMIGGLKGTGYFWPLLGFAEILCGVLLLSQLYALLGAMMLVPLSLNIFLFHLYLEPHEMGELVLTGLYLIINLGLLFYDYPKLKTAFLTK
ncbi:MAG: DoxX family membrane protein [Reichenbachiella sp.]|uniref:DoxX family membrane protein n=1 Tax=Reichenbachiella sp. TaxID=2184521 RepID=UPI003263BF95